MTSGNKRRSVAKCGSRDSGYRKPRSLLSKRSKTGSSATGREGDGGDRRRCTLSKQKLKLEKGSVAPTSADSVDGQEIDEAVAQEEVVYDDERSSTTTRSGGTATNTSPVKVTTKRKSGQAPLKSGRGRKKKRFVKWSSSVNEKENTLNGHENDDTATATTSITTTQQQSRRTTTRHSMNQRNEIKHHESASITATELLNNVNCGGGGYVCDRNGTSSNGHNQGDISPSKFLSSSTIEEKETTAANNGIGGLSNNTIPDRSLVGRVVKIYCDGEWKASRVIRAHTKKPFFYLLKRLLSSPSRKYVAKEWTLLNGSVTQFMFSNGIVWGRCKGYPPWPGMKYSLSKAAMESKILKPREPKGYLVIFFSTHDSAWLPENCISTFEPTPKQLNAPLDMLTKGRRKNKALAQAVKDAVKELMESRSLVDASAVDELELFASQLSSPTSWIGLQVRATKSRKGAVCGIVRAYSAAQRKWLIVWKGDGPLDPPPPPAWYGRHALQLDALPKKRMEIPLPGSGICRTCFVKNVNSDITGQPLSVITCFKCKSVYHGCCLDPPVTNSLIASAAAFQACQTPPPPCDDSYLSEDDEKEQQLQGENKEDEKQQRRGHERSNRVKLGMNERGKKRENDEEVGTTASVTTTLEVQVDDLSSSPPVNCVDQEKHENIKCEEIGTLEKQQQPGSTHSEGDDGANNNMSVDLINNGSRVGAGGDAQQNLSQHESLSTASCDEQPQTSAQKPGNENNNVMSEPTTVQIMRDVKERRILLEAEKDLPKLRSLLPGAENGQWICDGCIVCHGCGVNKRNDSSIKLHEKNLHFFCYEMDHGIENDSDFPNFDIFGPPPPSYSMLCKACISRFASGSFCPICEFTWKDEEEQCNLLGCDLCHFWVHAECEGFSSNEEFMLIQMGKHQVYGEGSRYACPACRARMQIDCLCSLINDDCHDFFALPVTSSVAPGYSKVIKNPMDLCTIERKMTRGTYCTMQAMRSDVELMVLNALTYNPRESPVYEFVLSYYSCCKKAFAAMEIKTVPSPHGVVIRNNHIRTMKAALNAKTTVITSKKNSTQQQLSPPVEEKKPTTTNNNNNSYKNEPCDIKIDNEIAQLRTLVPIPDPMVLPGFQGPTLWLTKGEAFYLSWVDLCISCGSAGSGEHLLYCRDCCEAFHDWCVLAPGGSMDAEARAGWRCNNCKICSLCYEARPNDDGVLLYCEVCDRAYHTGCLQPPLPRVPEGRWVCGRCVKCNDCSIPLTFREWSVTHDACKFCLRHCLRSHSAQDGVVWKRRQRLISVLQSKKGRGAIMSEASSWKTKPLETLANDQCPVCTGRWGSGGSHNLNQKPTALCECCGLYVHPQCDPDASKLCAMISSGTRSPLFDFFCASCLGIDLMQAAQELAQLDKLLREETIHRGIDDDNYELKSEVIDSNGSFSNHLGSSEAVLGITQRVGAIQRQRVLLSSAFLSRFINVASLAAEMSLRAFNVTMYEDVIDKARDMIEQLEQGKLEDRKEGQHIGQRCQFPSWKRSRGARFLRSYRMEKSNVKLGAALGHPGEVVKKCKSREQDSKAENSFKQELVVRQAMRAAAFLAVVSAELDLPLLDDFILMLSNQCPVDAPPSMSNDDIVVVDNSDLESSVQAVCQQGDDEGGTNANEIENINKMNGVEKGENYKKNQGNGGEMMLQSKDDEERIGDVSKLNDASACMIKEEEEGETQGECDNKVQQATAVLHQHMNVWTEICHAQFGEWLDPRECIFCHDVGDSIQSGRLLPFEDGQWVHINCLTWSSEVYENLNVNGELLGAHTARNRSKQLHCSVCGEKGATIDCQRKLCRFIFHFPCAILAGVRFCKDRTVWCNYHANCIPTARQKMVADFPTAPLVAESLNCDIGKHLRIATFREVPTGSTVTSIPLTGGGSGGAKNQAVGENLEVAASISSQQEALTTTSPPGDVPQINLSASIGSARLSSPPGDVPQINLSASTGSARLSPIPPPPPADFSLIEIQGSTARGLRVGSLTVYSLGELRPQRPGTVSRTHLFPVLDSADEWSVPLAPSGHDGVFFRISESGSSWAVSATSIEEAYGAVTRALQDSRGPKDTIPNRSAIGNIFGLNGPQFFGLGLPEVRYALECLPESVEAAMDCSEFQRYRFCFVKPDGSFVCERRRKKAEVAVVTKINPTGAARAEIRTHAVIANLVGRSSRTLLRSADSIIEKSVSLGGNNVIIRGEKKLAGGRRSGGGGNSNISVMGDGGNSSITTATIGDDDNNYSDNNGNAVLAEVVPLQALYRLHKMNDNGGGMCIVRRSKIHGWGLFAMKDFDAGDILIEYTGEVIRQCVADRRERKYEHLGVGSCYLFKIENDAIVDATRTGSVARFINHCCDPNAAARVLPSDTGAKKIVIIAKKSVKKGDEVTYDYKFAYEEDKLACHCGASNCMGSMN